MVFSRVFSQSRRTSIRQLLHPLIPVSYTHLDVYKRQLQIYRQMKADPLLDYSDFLSSLGEPVGYSCGNADPLDEVEWWLCICLLYTSPSI